MRPDAVTAAQRRLNRVAVPAGWTIVHLGDVFDPVIDTGHKEDLPVLSVTIDGRVVRRSSLDRRSDREVPREKYLRVLPGDIAYNTMRMWQGASGLVNEEGYISPAYTVCRAKAEEAPEFWAAYFRHEPMIRAFRDHSQGFAKDRYRLYYYHFATVPALRPPLPEQQKIADSLSSINETMKKAQDVRGSLQRLRLGLVRELLTGGATQGWTKTFLGCCLREPIRNGYSPVCPTSPTGLWMLHLGAVTEQGFNSKALKPAPLNDPRLQGSEARAGDIFVSRSNTRERVGLAGLYRGTPAPCYFPDLLMRVRPSSEVDAEFLAQVLRSTASREYFSKVARGTSGTMVKIDRALLEALPFNLPPLHEQRKIVAILSAVDDRFEVEAKAIAALQATKSSFLYSALFGEVSVPATP